LPDGIADTLVSVVPDGLGSRIVYAHSDWRTHAVDAEHFLLASGPEPAVAELVRLDAAKCGSRSLLCLDLSHDTGDQRALG